jgi:hypothetical protein
MKKNSLGSIEFSSNQVMGETSNGTTIFSPNTPKEPENVISAFAVCGPMRVNSEGDIVLGRDVLFHDRANDVYGKFDLETNALTEAAVMMAYRSGHFEKTERFEAPEADASRMHVLLSHNNPVLITQDSEKAFRQQKEFYLEPSVSLSKIMGELSLSSMVRIVDGNSWPRIAQAILDEEAPDIAEQVTPFFESTPIDLTPGLVQNRLHVLERLLGQEPQHTDQAVELMEMLIADRYDRPLNMDLIRDTSKRAPLFFESHSESLVDLQSTLDALQDEYLEKVSAVPRSQGTQATQNDIDIARLSVEMAEQVHLIDLHPEQSQHLSLG